MARSGVCGHEKGFAIVGKFKFCPFARDGGGGVLGGGGGGFGGGAAHVEGCERGFVVVAEVVE